MHQNIPHLLVEEEVEEEEVEEAMVEEFRNAKGVNLIKQRRLLDFCAQVDILARIDGTECHSNLHLLTVGESATNLASRPGIRADTVWG